MMDMMRRIRWSCFFLTFLTLAALLVNGQVSHADESVVMMRPVGFTLQPPPTLSETTGENQEPSSTRWDEDLDLDHDSDTDDTDLALAVQNPLAMLISVPIQANLDFGIGPKDADRLTVNVQPVIPFDLTEEWDLITRTIVPVIYQASPAYGVDREFGLGDTFQSFFLAPKKGLEGWSVGAGPVVLWPTATDRDLGGGKLGLGPTAVALRQEDGWTYGALVNHIWSVAGSSGRDRINQSIAQPFLARTFPTATSVGVNAEAIFDWTEEEWTVPVTGTISQILPVGGVPVSFQLGARYFVDAPSGGPEWGLRFGVTLLFPR